MRGAIRHRHPRQVRPAEKATRSGSRFKLLHACAIRLRRIEIVVYRTSLRFEDFDSLRMAIHNFAGGRRGHDFFAQFCRKDYGVAVGAVVARHDDLLRSAVSAKYLDELLDDRLLQKRVIDGVKQERRRRRDVLKSGLQGAELSFAPAGISHDGGIFRHGGLDQLGVASQNNDGDGQIFAIGDGDGHGGLTAENGEGFGKRKMRGGASSENNGHNALVLLEGQEGIRIKQGREESQALRDALRMQLVYARDTGFQLASRGHSHYNARVAARPPGIGRCPWPRNSATGVILERLCTHIPLLIIAPRRWKKRQNSCNNWVKRRGSLRAGRA